MKLIDQSIPKFLLVGVGNTLLSMAITYFLYLGLNVDTVIASAAGYVAGGVLSFFLNRHFTFHSQEGFWWSAAKFAFSVAVLWFISTPKVQPFVMGLLVDFGLGVKWAGSLSLLFCMGLYTVLNYFSQRFFAFQKFFHKR